MLLLELIYSKLTFYICYIPTFQTYTKYYANILKFYNIFAEIYLYVF